MNGHEVRIGVSSMRALRAFLSHPHGAIKLGDRLMVEAMEDGGVKVHTLPEPEPNNVSQHGEDLTAAYSPQEPPEED